jgi:pyridoxine/pyridoxamine 5'-phosphate oxidase
MADVSTNPAIVSKVKQLMDHSAANAKPDTAAIFAREGWKLGAEDFLKKWSEVRMVVVSSVGANGAPHSAVVHADFHDDGDMKMMVFTGSVRAQDLTTNPRVALCKYAEDGTVMTVYGKATPIAGTERPLDSAGGGGRAVQQYKVDVQRIYAMKPQGRG